MLHKLCFSKGKCSCVLISYKRLIFGHSGGSAQFEVGALNTIQSVTKMAVWQCAARAVTVRLWTGWTFVRHGMEMEYGEVSWTNEGKKSNGYVRKSSWTWHQANPTLDWKNLTFLTGVLLKFFTYWFAGYKWLMFDSKMTVLHSLYTVCTVSWIQVPQLNM